MFIVQFDTFHWGAYLFYFSKFLFHFFIQCSKEDTFIIFVSRASKTMSHIYQLLLLETNLFVEAEFFLFHWTRDYLSKKKNFLWRSLALHKIELSSSIRRPIRFIIAKWKNLHVFEDNLKIKEDRSVHYGQIRKHVFLNRLAQKLGLYDQFFSTEIIRERIGQVISPSLQSIILSVLIMR